MRPHRVLMTTSLVKGYGLDKSMQLIRPRKRTFEELCEFHADGEAKEGIALVSAANLPSPPRRDPCRCPGAVSSPVPPMALPALWPVDIPPASLAGMGRDRLGAATRYTIRWWCICSCQPPPGPPFPAADYIAFLKLINPDNQEQYMQQLRRFNMGLPGEADCPAFDGLFEYCLVCIALCRPFPVAWGNNLTRVCNPACSLPCPPGRRTREDRWMPPRCSPEATWTLRSTGREACTTPRRGRPPVRPLRPFLSFLGRVRDPLSSPHAGFCYVNDIVLGILELLKVFPRVLYVDIDIHHGDGVEEAFYLTDRVMTVSFHKYGDFFPGTGHLADIGHGKGKHYRYEGGIRTPRNPCPHGGSTTWQPRSFPHRSVNVPLKEGMDDWSYKYCYEPIMTKVMEMYQVRGRTLCVGPGAVVP